ncbi:hypothetical protein DVR12_18370 [Chitinophaga silvatica]|uniref:PKD domain-containing protein n=1 Tax=Chitinophaga silvatica TaxID=2282649 RepID=A0A3E1Y6F3_9BACT|nr:MBG domain-containing protein [Chitinophaga silvatica]RFS20532.1 hypothetical protein DVR12_18370 [Chitinophaga silvatica]
MKKYLLSIILSCITLLQAFAQSPDPNGIVYVKKGSTGNGNSWATATGELADALKAAATNPTIKQIWVAGGTYKPKYDPVYFTDGGTNNTFRLVYNVRIFGGFAGTENSLAQRDLQKRYNKSILSGDIGVLNTATDNAAHVVLGAGNLGTALLDGFTISDGYNNNSASINVNSTQIPFNFGAGIYIAGGSPQLSNLTIINNIGINGGGGMYIENSSAVMFSLIVSGNSTTGAFGKGGGIYFGANANVTLTTALISGNRTIYGGAGINNTAFPTISNATISANYSNSTGSGIDLAAGTLTLFNSIVTGNSNSGTEISGSGILSTNNIVSGSASFVNLPSFAIAPTIAGNFRLLPYSQAIDVGESMDYPGFNFNTKDLAGNPRENGILDLGAYEYYSRTNQTINGVGNLSKTYGDAPFEPGCTTNSGLTVSYVSSDSEIAEAFQDATDGNKWKIRIKGAGKVTITAMQEGNATYNAAEDVNFTLTIAKASLNIKVNDQVKVYDGISYSGNNGYTYTGFLYGDNESGLSGNVIYSGTSTGAINPGYYVMSAYGHTSTNYNISYTSGKLTILPPETPDINGILYVKKGSTGKGNSWANAAGEVSDALRAADMINAITPGTIKQIWVSGGKYTPKYLPGTTTSSGATSRDFAFPIIKDVKVYGGFAGNETSLSQRDLRITSNSSILSGDLGVIGDYSDNAYHVVTSLGDVGSATLDGFAIVGGNANAAASFNLANNNPFSGSTSKNTGAGFLCMSSSPLLQNLNIRSNQATNYGTAIYNNASSPTLVNVVISGNSGTLDGVGIFNFANSGSTSTPTLINTTICNNFSSSSGFTIAVTSNCNIIIRNSIIYGNLYGTTKNAIKNTSGNTLDIRSSLIQTMAADASRNILDGNLDPQFVGTITPSIISTLSTGGIYYLKSNSPAINAGENVAFPGLGASATDLGGNTRLAEGTIDLGAYEYQPAVAPRVLYVKKNGIGDGSSWNNAMGEVATALRAANINQQTEEIWVAGGTYSPQYGATDLESFSIDPRDRAFSVLRNIKIYGGFAGYETSLAARDLKITANNSILEGDLGSNNKVFHVLTILNAGNTEIDGFTVTNGNASLNTNTNLNGFTLPRYFGAGICHFSGQLTLSNMDINQNQTLTVFTARGGGIYSEATNLTVNNSRIYNNTGGTGGGIFALGSTLLLSNVSLQGNTATNGGGVMQTNGIATFNNVLSTGNTVTGLGSAIQTSNATITINNNTVSGNKGTGAAVYIDGTSSNNTQINNSIIYNNAVELFTGNTTLNMKNNLVKGRAADANNSLDGTTVIPDFVSPLATTDAPSIGGDYQLKAGSAAIDAGDNTLFPNLDANTKDLAGNLRVTNFSNGGKIDLGVYEFTPNSQSISTINPVTKVYGDIPFEPGATATSNLTVEYASSDDDIATAIQDANDGNKWKIKVLKVGTVTITATQPGNAAYAAATPVDFSLTISKAPLTITANDASKTYNGLAYSGGNGVSYSGFVNNETSSVVTGTVSYNGNSQSAINTGTFAITPAGLTASNYDITYADGTLTINPATLTATANAASKTYDGNTYSGSYGVTITGFVNNETNAIVTGTPNYSGSALSATLAGTYTITPAGLTAPNYTIIYTDGTLTINPATLTATANAASKTYDGLTYSGSNSYTITGFVNNETDAIVTGTATYSGNYQSATNVGTYTITPAGLTAPNYTINYADGTLTINSATLTATANAASKTYDGITYNGGNGVTVTGFVNNETSAIVTGTVTYSGNSQTAKNVGTYTITPAGLTAPNYTINYTDGTLTINPASLTATANAASKTYDGLTYSGGNGVTVTGFVNNETDAIVTGTATYSGNSQTAKNVGTYTITPVGLTAPNYNITYTDGTLTINPATLTATANAANKTYDGLTYSGGNGVTVTGFLNNETSAIVTGTATYSGNSQTAKNVGTYTITPAGLSAPNYTINYADGTLTINSATLTANANAASKTYDGITYNGGNGVTVTGFVNNETDAIVTGTVTYSGNSQTAKNVGTYIITPTGLTAPNYTINYIDGALTINPASLTATANAASKTYDGIVYNGGNGVTVTGFVNNETEVLVTGTATYSGNSQSAKNVGTYTITPAGLTAPNYTINYTDGTLTINPASLTATANAASKTYDGVAYNGGNGVTVTGFVNNETDAIVTGTATYSGNSQTAKNVGAYTITPAGLTAPNYTINYADGTLTINPATLTATANAASKTYDGVAYNGGNGVTVTGFVNNESSAIVTGTATYSGNSQSATNVGTYTITPVGLTAPNYNITYTDGTLTINPATLTATANAASKTYDGLTYSGGNGVTVTGFVNNETNAIVTGTATYSGNSQLATNVGTYTITPAGLTAPNYTINYTDGTLTINPATLTATANAVSKTYDGVAYNGGNGVTVTGFVNNETEAIVTGTVTYSGNSQTAKNVGTYTITPTGLTAPNYTINYADGALTINPATLTAKANAASKTYDGITYNGGNGVTVTGFVNNETSTIVTGTATYSGNSQTAKNVGTYTITPAGLTAPNYTINYTDGALTINPATLTAKANAASKTYDGITYNGGNGIMVTGFVNNENDAIVTGTATYSGNSQSAKNVGTYTITPAGLTAPNYTINYTDGTLTINPASLTATANAASKTYDGVAYNGGNGVTYTGFVNNETSAIVAGTITYSGNSQSAKNVGTYTITPAGLIAPNYTITYTDGVLTINPATLTVKANTAGKTYDGIIYNGGNGVTYTGFVNNETSTVVTGTITYSGTSQTAKNVGTYVITPAGVTAPNYTINYTDGTLTINPATLTITANDQNYCFGGTKPSFTTSYLGWVNGETVVALSQQPVVQSTANTQSPAGIYDLIPTGASALNYTFNYVNGTLKINALPVSDITTPQGSILCGSGASLNLQATGNYYFRWKLNNNDIPGANLNTLSATTTGSYSAIATDANGCSAPATGNVVITQLSAPSAAFTYDLYCVDKKITFTNQSDVRNSGNVNYSWNNGDGTTSNTVSPQFIYKAAGDYNVTLTATSVACPTLTATISKTIKVEAALADMELTPVTIDAGMPAVLTGRNLNEATYRWSAANGLSNPGVYNPVATLDQSQRFNIEMTFPSGCTTTDHLQVTVNQGNAILIPNVFSPNGDGQNDILYPNLKGIKKLHYFKIFNRWGKLMFETSDEKKGWNGYYNGELQPLATYVWTVEGVDINGAIYRSQGTVTLLR